MGEPLLQNTVLLKPLKMLLATGEFDLNAPDEAGLTPLFYAIRYGSEYETGAPS